LVLNETGSIIEPTRGRRAFVVAAADELAEAEMVIGIDLA
jgi:hypothetical protein